MKLDDLIEIGKLDIQVINQAQQINRNYFEAKDKQKELLSDKKQSMENVFIAELKKIFSDESKFNIGNPYQSTNSTLLTIQIKDTKIKFKFNKSGRNPSGKFINIFQIQMFSGVKEDSRSIEMGFEDNSYSEPFSTFKDDVYNNDPNSFTVEKLVEMREETKAILTNIALVKTLNTYKYTILAKDDEDLEDGDNTSTDLKAIFERVLDLSTIFKKTSVD